MLLRNSIPKKAGFVHFCGQLDLKYIMSVWPKALFTTPIPHNDNLKIFSSFIKTKNDLSKEGSFLAVHSGPVKKLPPLFLSFFLFQKQIDNCCKYYNSSNYTHDQSPV